jgi:hypothetical protein
VWKVFLKPLSDLAFAVEKQGPFTGSHLACFLITVAPLVSDPPRKTHIHHGNLHSPKEWSGLAQSTQLLKVSDNIQGDRQSHQAGRRRILQGMPVEGQQWPLEPCSISSLQLSFYVPERLLARLC